PGSRGGLLALAAGVITLFLARSESMGARARSGAVAVLSLALVAVFAYQTPVMRNRLSDTARSGAMAGREDLYPLVGQMFVEKPILGWGPENNQYERSEEHTSELQSRGHLVCRLLLEKKKTRPRDS